jgi:hypothetical protein
VVLAALLLVHLQRQFSLQIGLISCCTRSPLWYDGVLTRGSSGCACAIVAVTGLLQIPDEVVRFYARKVGCVLPVDEPSSTRMCVLVSCARRLGTAVRQVPPRAVFAHL